jgi:hypothetical protein
MKHGREDHGECIIIDDAFDQWSKKPSHICSCKNFNRTKKIGVRAVNSNEKGQ